MSVLVREIQKQHLPSVAKFLQQNLNADVAWGRGIDTGFGHNGPNYGFMLLDESRNLVGVYTAYYSWRQIGNFEMEKFCNLGAWCVLEKYRLHSIKLLSALLKQEGYSFTDLSPKPHVVKLGLRMGMQLIDTSTVVVPGLPWVGSAKVSSDPAVVEATLTGLPFDLYLSHARVPAARHTVIQEPDGTWCYVVWRKDKRYNRRAFASVLYVSDKDLFERNARKFYSHLLLKFGVVATLAELRIVGSKPQMSWAQKNPRKRMFKGKETDYLFSELACVDW